MRVIKRDELTFLKKELDYLAHEGVFPSEKTAEILAHYEVRDRPSFTKTLLYVGTILIGAGILSFIASNWAEIERSVKFLLIIGMYIGCMAAGFKLERNFPKTSKSFYYLGVIIFGAGIFLVEQIFHLGGSPQRAFLWWSLGSIPIAWVLRDKWILLAAAVFTLIHMLDEPYFSGNMIPIWVLLWIGAIYVINEKIGFSRITGFVLGIGQLIFIGTVFSFFISRFDLDDYFYLFCLIYLMIGIILAILKGKIRDVYVLLGYITHGAAALALSFEDIWPSAIDWIYLPFSLAYLLLILFFIKRGSLLGIIILCVLIFRFYLDISFEFLPKSFVFMIGGILLVGFGFYFEKQRRKGDGIHG